VSARAKISVTAARRALASPSLSSFIAGAPDELVVSCEVGGGDVVRWARSYSSAGELAIPPASSGGAGQCQSTWPREWGQFCPLCVADRTSEGGAGAKVTCALPRLRSLSTSGIWGENL
jgi:hypothetical protein